jgi:hypothetical protein
VRRPTPNEQWPSCVAALRARLGVALPAIAVADPKTAGLLMRTRAGPNVARLRYRGFRSLLAWRSRVKPYGLSHDS